MNNRRRRTSLEKYIPLTLFVRVQQGYSGFACEGSWRPNITEIFWPQTYGRQRCVFLVLQGRRPRAHSAGWWLSLLHLISIFSGPQLIRAQMAPSAWCGFPYHISSHSVRSPWNSNSTGSSNSTELYNRSTPTRSLKSNV